MRKKGFSLIEVLLSISLMSFLSVSVYVVNIQFLQKNELQNATSILSDSLAYAQTSATTMRDDSDWGVHYNANQIVVFKGNVYSSRDMNYDQVYVVTQGINITGANDLVYKKYTGALQNPGNVVITSRNNETKTIQVNSVGAITY